MSRPQATVCPDCRRLKPVNTTGTIRIHVRTTGEFGEYKCPGSGKPARKESAS